MVMTPDKRVMEFDQAIHLLKREVTLRTHGQAGRDVLGQILAALWVLRAEATNQPEQMLN